MSKLHVFATTYFRLVEESDLELAKQAFGKLLFKITINL